MKDEKSAQKVGYLTAALFLIFPIVFMLPPIVSQVMIPDLPDKEMAYVAISSQLLPPGLMGVMIASMFSATMSSLNSEYNVIASVLSKDVYQRLINRHATDHQMLIVAKLSTVLIGLLVLMGGLFIKDFGGAFEANKLFTGIFAIPVGVPLVLGIVNRKATPKGALLTVILGAVSGIVLNSLPSVFSWEMATLIETFICLVIFYSSTLWSGGNSAYQARVSELFEKLKMKIATPPIIEPGFRNALTILYVVSLIVSGMLFIGMGFPSIGEYSGALSVASGLVCFFIGGLMWFFKKKRVHG